MQAADSIQIRYCALILGVLFLLLGLAGLTPEFIFGSENVFPGPGYGYLFGVFPTNYFHSAIGILVGIWGLAAYTSLSGSITFNQAFAIIYFLQAVLGIFPFARTLFGMMPLYGYNIGLSLLTAAVAYYYGFVKPGPITKATGVSANTQ